MRPRPSNELLEAQREAKMRWRREQAALPIREKLRRLLEMQRTLLPVIQQRRALRPWEQPWDIEP